MTKKPAKRKRKFVPTPPKPPPEALRNKKCKRCGERGHNVRTCKVLKGDKIIQQVMHNGAAIRKEPVGVPTDDSGRVVRVERGTAVCPERTAENKRLFLALLESRFTISHACKELGIGRRTVYNWRDEDATFAAALSEAREHALDELEECMFQRAKHRDTIAGIFLLKGNRPERYHERRHDVVTGPNGGPIVVSWTDLAKAALNAPQQTPERIEQQRAAKVIDAKIEDDVE